MIVFCFQTKNLADNLSVAGANKVVHYITWRGTIHRSFFILPQPAPNAESETPFDFGFWILDFGLVWGSM